MRYYFSFLFVFFFLSNGYSQLPLFKEIKLSYEGRVLNIQDALVDKNGIIWLCTEDGLYLSDGVNVSVPEGINSGPFTVTAIVETSGNKIIVGTDKGAILQFKNYALSGNSFNGQLTEFPISSIKEDAQERLFIGTKGKGIFVLENNKIVNFSSVNGLNDDFIYTIEITHNDTLLIGSDRGINFCKLSNGKLTILSELTDKNGLKDNMVTQLKMSKSGMLCIGSQDFGFQIYNVNTHQFLVNDAMHGVGSISCIENMENEQWVGLEDGQIMDVEYSPTFLVRPLTDKGNRLFQRVQKIVSWDLNTSLVIANKRVYITSGEWNEKIESPDRNSELKCLTYFKQELYAVYESGIFTKKQHQSWQKRVPIFSSINYKAISSICVDNNGVIWLGSLNDGLIFIASNGFASTIMLDNINFDMSIFTLTIIEDKLLVGTMNGIFMVNWKTKTMSINNDSLSNAIQATRGKYIYTIIGNSLKKLHFGTDSYGYGIIENGNINFFTNFSSSNQKSVLSMTATSDYQNIWFSTLDIGLFKMQQNDFFNKDKKYTFNKYRILGIGSDNNDNLFLVHENQISIVNPLRNQQYSLPYDNHDINLNNNMISQTNEFIFIGTKDGIISIQPKRFKYPENIPVTVLNTLLFLKKLDSSHSMSFNHNEHDISFKCYFPWFQNPEQVRYEYYLEGFSSDTFESNENLISFPNLRPGKYIFKVRGKVEGFLLNTPWTLMPFEIRKAWYNSFWFYALASLIILFLFYLFVRLRLQQLRRVSEIKTNHLRQEIRVLNSQVNPHFLFNSFSSLIGLIETDSKKAVEYTENLSDFYRNIVKYKEAENIPIASELSITETYIMLQNIRFNGAIHFEVSEEIRNLNKNIPPMTFQILSENAIKHNKLNNKEPLSIKIENKNGVIYFSNNINLKITRENSTNSGLSFVKDRVFITTGKLIEIEQNDSFFIVKIPIN